MELKKRKKVVAWLIIGAVVLFLGLLFEFFRHRYQVNRNVIFTTEGSKLQLFRDKKQDDFYIKGLLLRPGEAGTTRAEYAAWIRRAASLNVNVIQVHDVHPPAFYQAFFEYNLFTDRPVYLLHGIWLDDAVTESYQNAYDDRYIAEFFEEIRRVIDTVHGKASNDQGKYNFNASPYIMGYVLCEPPEPGFITFTIEQNAHVIGFEGDYIYTVNASPFEAWLAAMGNYAVSYEKDRYGGTSRLVSWTSRTDISPVIRVEDHAEVDFEHINATEKFNAGIFASYRVLPDEPRLRALEVYYSMPVVLMEWNVPATGVAEVFEEIVRARIGGGVIFSIPEDHLQEFYAIIRQQFADH
ncbi:MAG: hypothetical protein FWG46_05190 [Treponema sp.]|nr:hypothetical protein [Treponema sp.]